MKIAAPDASDVKKEILHFYFLTDHGKITRVLKQMQRV